MGLELDNVSKYDIRDLAEKWMRGALTSDEEAYLSEWYNSFDDHEVRLTDSTYETTDELKSKIYRRLIQRIEHNSPRNSKHWSKGGLIFTAGIAVSLLLIFTLFIPSGSKKADQVLAPMNEDVPPGENKAYVTLPNGQHVNLNPNRDGIKSKDGRLYYTDGTPINKEATKKPGKLLHEEWITIATPYGGQYKVVLPDGSKVWLNAGSSLQYPVHFNEKNREVRFQGEAYFEIAKVPLESNPNKNTPFTVHMTQQTVEVVGTAFNINGYKDEEKVQTTLVSGSLHVIVDISHSDANERTKILQPNEQATVYGQELEVHSVNALSKIAWKNGIFLFENDKLSDIMHQLQRWYNVEVDYQSMPNLHFTGSVDRNEPLSKVLEMLEVTSGLEFKIKNRKIYLQTEERIVG